MPCDGSNDFTETLDTLYHQAIVTIYPNQRRQLDCASQYQCAARQRYKCPNAVAPATISTTTTFNQLVQADVMWAKSNPKKFPILSIIDTATKYQAATVLHGGIPPPSTGGTSRRARALVLSASWCSPCWSSSL